jgi:hypothetical protein
MRLILNTMQGVLMAAMIGSFSVAAAQEPFFAGIGIGAAKTRIGNHPLGITGATATSLSRDENDIGGKMFAGYRLYPNWAVEAGYVDLGKTSAKRTMTAPGTGSISLDSRNAGWFVDLVGRMPIGNGVSLIGKWARYIRRTGSSYRQAGRSAWHPVRRRVTRKENLTGNTAPAPNTKLARRWRRGAKSSCTANSARMMPEAKMRRGCFR